MMSNNIEAVGGAEAVAGFTGNHPVLEILEDLVRINSVNPYYEEGAPGESGVACYVEERMRRAGIPVRRQQVFAGRWNVVAELSVGKPERALLFESHMDTVPAGSMEKAFEAQIRDGRLYGRGACDTKATLAGMIWAIEYWAARRDSLPRDLVLCAAVDEEAAFRGVLRFLEEDREQRLAGAVVGEPTELRVVSATKGCARFAVETRGKAAHSSMPEEGDNAIYRMLAVLSYIRDREAPRLEGLSHPLCGRASISVGTIESGGQINIVPERCEIQVDRRILPGEQPDVVREQFKQALGAVLPSDTVFEVRELLSDWALDTDPQAAIVREALRVAETLGLATEPVGVPYGTDASKLQQLGGIPSIVFGPGSIAQAHSKHEWVDLEEVVQAAAFYATLAGVQSAE
jgi:acetylornithine deacetylase/succinyl-diaminopimelate desuccinylase-like protein